MNKIKSAFYVVKFIEVPFEGIDEYVCIPGTWLIVRRARDQRAVVAYPEDEDPSHTRDRVMRKERCNDEWRYYMAEVKYESDNYDVAALWIDNNTQPKLDTTLCSANRNGSPKSKKATPVQKVKPYDHPRKPLPRPLLPKPKKCNEKIIRDQLLDIAQTEKTAEAFNGKRRTKKTSQPQYPEQNQIDDQSDPLNMQLPIRKRYKQALSLPIIDVDEPTGGEDHTQGDEQPSETNSNSQSHISSNAMAASVTVPTPPTTGELTPLSYEHNNQQHLIDSINSSSNFQPQIVDVRSTATIHIDQKSHDDVSNNEQPNSLKMSSALYNNMGRRLIPFQMYEKKIRPKNFARTMAVASQNPSDLMDQTGSLSTRSVEQQPSIGTQDRSQDAQWVPKMHARSNIDQTYPLRDIEICSQDIQHGPKINVGKLHDVTTVDAKNVQTFERTIERNSTDVSNSLQQTFELPQQGQLQPNHQDSQQQPRSPSIHVHISIKANKKTPMPTLQGDTTRMPPPVQSKVSNSILKKAILTTIYNYVQNERQLQASLSGRSTDQNDTDYTTAPRNITAEPTRDKHSSKIPTCSSHQSPTRIQRTSAPENVHQNTGPQKQMVDKSTEMTMNRVHFKDNVVKPRAAGYLDSACQTNECMLEESLSSYRKLEMISDQEMSTEKPPVETTNHVDWTGFSTESNSADRPTAAQNSTSTNHQTHPRVILEQQMLDHFATLFTQMGSTLNYTRDMYNNLRDSIHEVADTYKTLLGTVERFNTLGNSVSNAAPYSNVTPEVPQVTETVEIQTEVITRENSGNGDQHSNNDDNKAPKKIHNNLRRFVIPLEYDPNDTRWTLKYKQNMLGLVELMPQSGIYVSYGDLKYLKQKSKDCKTLARRLLSDVFSREALSVCLSPSESALASNNVSSNVRPKLDEHACKVLLRYVLEYGLKCGWNIDIQPILNGIHSTVRKIRFRYGVNI